MEICLMAVAMLLNRNGDKALGNVFRALGGGFPFAAAPISAAQESRISLADG
jgi:hypothetical protein